jgi:hypothetical protein
MDALADGLAIQPADQGHTGDAAIAQLQGLEGGKQAALPGIHQAQEQVDLLVQDFLGVVVLALALRLSWVHLLFFR